MVSPSHVSSFFVCNYQVTIDSLLVVPRSGALNAMFYSVPLSFAGILLAIQFLWTAFLFAHEGLAIQVSICTKSWVRLHNLLPAIQYLRFSAIMI